tara:strand:- start:349 stop:1107 length:759 start_codon:yes stop_codon:yes gene_type:complete
MEIYEIIVLGIIQGITEFLPISSSGHLVIAQHLLDIKSPGNTLEVLFHFGTLLSVIFIFFKDIKKIIISINDKSTRSFVLYIIISSLPAVFAGLFFKDYISKIFDNVYVVGLALFITGILLVFSKNFKNRQNNLTLSSSILIGITQAFSIIPGISRSGSTITVGMFLGIPPSEAARFSFILSIPIILGASILGFLEIESSRLFNNSVIIVAIITSFFTGVLALKILLRILEAGKFHLFGIYCIFIGVFTLFI